MEGISQNHQACCSVSYCTTLVGIYKSHSKSTFTWMVGYFSLISQLSLFNRFSWKFKCFYWQQRSMCSLSHELISTQTRKTKNSVKTISDYIVTNMTNKWNEKKLNIDKKTLFKCWSTFLRANRLYISQAVLLRSAIFQRKSCHFSYRNPLTESYFDQLMESTFCIQTFWISWLVSSRDETSERFFSFFCKLSLCMEESYFVIIPETLCAVIADLWM